jgi:hypothetical protein
MLMGDVAGIIAPVLKGVFSNVLSGIVSDITKGASAMQEIGGLLGLAGNIVNLFQNADYSAIPAMIASFAWNIVQLVLAKATAWQKFQILAFGAGWGAGDALSGGAFQAGAALLGSFQLISDITLTLGSDMAAYNNMCQNG